ncbi:TetR/AcrR family transcriptional regulator C-terminal domain-containing protein [Embleya sp. NPDC005575]|uniref:TetR/AcrR family transcriptional regulator C-terminal domain-containing protein n=1 Tax=Embleya sp. NPDC005575 TaxID=3156892 RepID=UPI0033AA2362
MRRARLVMGSMPRLPDLGRTWRELGPERFHVVVRTALAELVERGELEIDDVPLAAIQLSGLVLMPHIAYGSSGAVPDADPTRRLIIGGVDMFLARYRPAADAADTRIVPAPPAYDADRRRDGGWVRCAVAESACGDSPGWPGCEARHALD